MNFAEDSSIDPLMEVSFPRLAVLATPSAHGYEAMLYFG
jgi:hypothetical protein